MTRYFLPRGGYFVYLFLLVSFDFSSAFFSLLSRYERRGEFSVKDGGDWDTRTRCMMSSSHADYGPSRFKLRSMVLLFRNTQCFQHGRWLFYTS